MTVDNEYGTGPDWVQLGTKARKFAVALVGGAVTVTSAGVLPEEWAVWVAGVVAFLTALGVYRVENVD